MNKGNDHTMHEIENQIILVTGSTDGLGKHVARDLAKIGATVLLHGRNRQKGQHVLREIQKDTGNENIAYYNADFASLDEVRGLAEKIKTDFDRLDVLINNAGVGERGGAPREESEDGYELLFAVNYLAPFLLTHELKSLLCQSVPARVVNVSSMGQQALDFDDVMLETGGYDGFRAYMQSKLALIMFTFDFAEEMRDSGVKVNALHPATHMDTKMVRETTGLNPINTTDEGAKAVEYLAVSQDLEGVSGEYFNGKQEERANQQAYKKGDRQQLWELSEQLVEG